MKNIFDDIRIKYEKPIRLYCDNNFAINIEHNLKHNKTKHIKIDQHFIKEKLESGLITNYRTHPFRGFSWWMCFKWVSPQNDFKFLLAR